jgi:hypothetical protein
MADSIGEMRFSAQVINVRYQGGGGWDVAQSAGAMIVTTVGLSTTLMPAFLATSVAAAGAESSAAVGSAPAGPNKP